MNEEQQKEDERLLRQWSTANMLAELKGLPYVSEQNGGVKPNMVNKLLEAQKRIVQTEERERISEIVSKHTPFYSDEIKHEIFNSSNNDL